MKKERFFMGCLKENKKVIVKNKCHSKLDLESSTQIISQDKQQRQAWKILKQVQDDDSLFHNGSGFTLIELLVVVLIIGILAAVAVPQYRKAVWKSRTIQMRTLQNSLATAQNEYFMANGNAPTQFGELDVGFDNLTAANSSTLGAQGLISHTDVVRYNDLFEIYLGTNTNQSWFRRGPYKGCGFNVNYKTKQWHCTEWYVPYTGTKGNFCRKIMGAVKASESNSVWYYSM